MPRRVISRASTGGLGACSVRSGVRSRIRDEHHAASGATGLLLTTLVVGAMVLTACAPTRFAAFNAGKNFQDAQKFSEAIDKYNEFVNQNQGSTLVPYALYYIGECYIGLDKNADALAALEKVKEQYPASDQARRAELAIQRLQGSAHSPE